MGFSFMFQGRIRSPALPRLLRSRHERPRGRAAEQRDELTPFHVGHGTAGHQRAMALCGRFAAHSAYHGAGGTPEMF